MTEGKAAVPFASPCTPTHLPAPPGGPDISISLLEEGPPGSTVGWDKAPHASDSLGLRAAVHEEGFEMLNFKSPLGPSLLSPK